MTDERQMAVAYLAVAVVAAISSNSTIGLALVASSLVALLVGYRRRIPLSTAAAGLLLYYPLAAGFGRVVPAGWGYIASAVLLIALSERLSFEYRMSSPMKTPLGMDEESRSLAAGLSKSHGEGLVWYVGAAAGVSVLSIAASVLTPYWVLLVAGSVLLVFALWGYARR
ncbi:MAG TPA: hypothetical protein VKF15_08255 [Nitrososphaerales archaeon]|nr:hypothetical protein [Nitrososphaerales archaeon]